VLYESLPKRAMLAAAASLGGVAATAAAGPPQKPDPQLAADPAATADVTARIAAPPARALGRLAGRVAARSSGFTIVRLRPGRRIALRVAPAGRIVRVATSRTEFGSPQTMTVVKRRGRWLGVTSSLRGNNALAWVDARSSALSFRRTRVWLRVDLSRRILTFYDGRHARWARVGIGGQSSPTPTGRFSVTDKLSGPSFSASYGCCILALSGRQTNLPAGWTGGDRLAIHGAAATGEVRSASAGCVRADTRTLRALMRRVPLGTPVFVRA
jgi:lipoprotein-anchoring transpeptidase ErfK/SrfK